MLRKESFGSWNQQNNKQNRQKTHKHLNDPSQWKLTILSEVDEEINNIVLTLNKQYLEPAKTKHIIRIVEKR